ncbi:MAG: HAMP domain-containing histidine kinase [Ruminococcaceae bacterium]|nr:HAMP domain-containing histidine kinase [Oscillospiraceae bacterium]
MKGVRKRISFRIGLIFTAIVMGEILVTVGIASLLSGLLDITGISATVWLWIFSILIGGALSWYVNHRILKPITRLSDAMDRVAAGEFNVTLASHSRIREIRNIYEKFNLMTGELRSTEILQRDFISNVSHEIKTPINAIEGYVTLLQSTENIDETEEIYIEKILLNTRRLSELVGNILLLSKLENCSIEAGGTCFRLDEQIRLAIMLLEPKWQEKELGFDVELEELTYYGNTGLLCHVWSNLIGNAVKFSPRGGEVTLRLWEEGERLCFSVADQGEGISPEVQKRMFQQFYQGDSSHKAEGNGLGLTLAKRILDLCGGEIFGENLREGGCRFTVYLQKTEKLNKT